MPTLVLVVQGLEGIVNGSILSTVIPYATADAFFPSICSTALN
jgi:hypothetical protein